MSSKRPQPPSPSPSDDHPTSATSGSSKRARRTSPTSNMPSVNWGDWLKSTGSAVDHEQERIDRQKAAFGGETVARIKDLSVLILGCAGTGVETAKNLILSNVGAVSIWDPTVCLEPHRGSNFYVTPGDVVGGRTLAEASLGELRTLNPYCRVEVVGSLPSDEEVASYSAVVVTRLLPRPDLLRINDAARNAGVPFVLAATNGVTASIFSDFGTRHEITDATGEPTQTLAVSNLEVVDSKPSLLKVSGAEDGSTVVIATVAQAEHGLEDGDVVVLDDMRGGMERLNGRRVTVRRVAISSPTAAKVDTRGVAFKTALGQSTSSVVANFEKQYEFYKQQFDEDPANGGRRFPVRTITIFNRLAFVLDDENGRALLDDPAGEGGPSSSAADVFSGYVSGGLLNQQRPVVVKEYRSLAETLEKTAVPQMLRGEDWEDGKGVEVHLSIAAALEFQERKGHWPRLHDADDASDMVKIAEEISKGRESVEGSCRAQTIQYGFPTGEPRDLDSDRITRYSCLFEAELTGFCAYLGGAAAQEVLKATARFTPVDQWIHHDEACLAGDACPSNVGPLFGSRYDHQIAVLGKDFQSRLADQKVFLVGCGALGCEYLKGVALMGVGTGKCGKVIVTDMDRIEVSNLSRQFLFRQDDVGHPKSVRGALVVRRWNPDVNIEALERKVGDDTEDYFDDAFWEGQDLIWNALDNVLARRYTDAKCLFYSKPLLESGTLGTKCNHEVVLPFRTSSYNDGKESDDQENQIAMCTLRSFPYLAKHCIEFAKQAYFADYFEFGPEVYESFRQDPMAFFEQLDTMEPAEQSRSLKMIKTFIDLQEEAGGTIDFDGCVRIAFNRMMKDFRTSILDLCHSADEMEKSSGNPFWTGTKRKPRPVDWTEPAPLLWEYLYATANLYACVWKVDVIRDLEQFQSAVERLNLEQPVWSPGAKVDLSEGDNDDDGASEDDDKLKGELYKVDTSKLQPAQPQEFEKDEDDNFHVDFLTVSTNMRAYNYDIKASARHAVKVTAGRIIPALATTTAMVCGLVDIEFCKLVLGLQSQGSDKFLNSNINLAAGSGNFTTFAPDPPVAIKTGLDSPHPAAFSSWDKIELSCKSKELSVDQLVQYLERSFGVSVDRIFLHGDQDDKAIYNAVDRQKLEWSIDFGEDGKVAVSDGVFTLWPQVRMAVQMLGRLPPTSGQRAIFKSQVEKVKKALDQTKESFMNRLSGPVSLAFREVYRPAEEGEKQTYFDTVFNGKDYVTLGVDCHTDSEDEIILPCIKYTFTH